MSCLYTLLTPCSICEQESLSWHAAQVLHQLGAFNIFPCLQGWCNRWQQLFSHPLWMLWWIFEGLERYIDYQLKSLQYGFWYWSNAPGTFHSNTPAIQDLRYHLIQAPSFLLRWWGKAGWSSSSHRAHQSTGLPQRPAETHAVVCWQAWPYYPAFAGDDSR